MKLIIVAFALAIAFPAAAQTAPAQHRDHGQHQAGQQGHDQHGQHQPGQHQGHGDGCCADRNNNGRMDCCEQAEAGQRGCCCAGHGEGHAGQQGEPSH